MVMKAHFLRGALVTLLASTLFFGCSGGGGHGGGSIPPAAPPPPASPPPASPPPASPPPGSLPDLTASGLAFESTTVAVGDEVPGVVTITNAGKASAGAFRVGLYKSPDGAVTTEGQLTGSTNVSGVDAGESGLILITLVIVPPGGRTGFLAMIADDENAVTESDESNNTSNAVQITVK